LEISISEITTIVKRRYVCDVILKGVDDSDIWADGYFINIAKVLTVKSKMCAVNQR
jgi:hypothetical protein